ncbi:hypothetical protein SBI_01521 [Streptomyces bingchenggensis BCW-1]|uniref:Uncharacterized protein n=2 Tax=Streptomyces TaxID=1883 RepID=D7CDX7_STRBB|nr:hypothetical protein SBI_01521 [Streptomyces bingchenggensis BCW-1]
MFSLAAEGTILIGGHNMGASKKWRNLQADPKLAFVVDDVVSFRSWKARFVEIRGRAELLDGATARRGIQFRGDPHPPGEDLQLRGGSVSATVRLSPWA